MIIGVAGPYSAHTPEQRQLNLDAMNTAAAQLLELGHIPIIGMNAALPVVEIAQGVDKYKSAMDISMAVIAVCDGLLLLAESPGANKERDLILSKGKPVFRTIDEIIKTFES
jgi:glutamate 5-kinase